jgi:hypothetical protein
MKTVVRLLWTVPLLFALCGCDRLTHFRLVSEEYGFSVEFPEKPIEHTDTNYQGLSKTLWTLEKDASKEFYSAEATSYKEALNPSPDWIPDQEVLGSVGIQITDHKRFKLRATSTGREVQAIAMTAKQLSTGSILSSIYIVDRRTMISVTARTNDERHRREFLNSLSVIR